MRAITCALVSVSLALGCAAQPSGLENEKACTPGQQVACACPKGAQGVQLCSSSGHAFTPCDCSGTTGVAGGSWGSGGEGSAPAEGGAPSSGGAPATGGGGGGGVSGSAGTSGAGGGGGGPTGGGGASGGGGSSGGGGWGATGGWAGGSSGPVGDYAGAISVSEIAVYQGVKVSLMKNNQGVTQKNAPIIEGRPALVRVFVAPGAGFSSRKLTALLDLKSNSPAVAPQTVSLQVSSASSDSSLASTFNFSLPPDQVTADLALRVSLHEPAGSSAGGVEAGVAWPAQGHSALGAQASGPVRVTIVPFRYWGDGSGRLPDTSETQMKAYHDVVFATYPTPKVELGLRAPVDYQGYVGPSSGWSSWLDKLCDLRASDKVDSKVYYFGVMAPQASWSSYGGGIAGLGNVPYAEDTYSRCAVGLGFKGADPSGFIMAHELGHTHGRPHAPCGVSGEPFPYTGAKIGAWGHSLVSNSLKDPQSFRDLMSYCDPQWISDVNFGKLFKRIQYVQQNYFVVSGPPKRYLKLLVDVDGSLVWGRTVELEREPGGQPREVALLGKDGHRIATVVGRFAPFGDEPAGALFIPEPSQGVVAVAPAGMPEVVIP